MELFRVIIKNEKGKSHRLIALFILFLHVAIFSYLMFFEKSRTGAGSALVIIIIYVLIQWNYQRKGKQKHLFNEFLFFVFAFGWLGLGVYSLVAINMVMGLLYFLALQKIEFHFDDSGVTKINLPKKKYEWSEFSNVLLKDNFLTLDFKNNKIIQAEIEPLQDINEQDFNSSCSQKILLSTNNN